MTEKIIQKQQEENIDKKDNIIDNSEKNKDIDDLIFEDEYIKTHSER